jgi:hypothetical protein
MFCVNIYVLVSGERTAASPSGAACLCKYLAGGSNKKCLGRERDSKCVRSVKNSAACCDA